MARKRNAEPAMKIRPPYIYTKAEFMANARDLFGVNSDIVCAAFAVQGKTEASITEAKTMVNEFMNKKV